jgi:hypothetical protein
LNSRAVAGTGEWQHSGTPTYSQSEVVGKLQVCRHSNDLSAQAKIATANIQNHPQNSGVGQQQMVSICQLFWREKHPYS